MTIIAMCPNPVQNDGYFDLSTLTSGNKGLLRHREIPALQNSQSIQPSETFQYGDEIVNLMIDDSTIEHTDGLFAEVANSSPRIESALALELPLPKLKPEEILLQWKRMDSSVIQEVPMPDLESSFSPFLWQDDLDLIQLNCGPVQLLEQPNETSGA